MIKVKASVRFSVFRPEIYSIFDDVDFIFAEYGYDAVITCGTEAHGEDDPHTHGFAVDLRSHHISTLEEKRRIKNELSGVLGENYTVILESVGKSNEHFHVQVKKGLWRKLL